MQLHISSAIRSVVQQPIKSPFQSSTRDEVSPLSNLGLLSEPHLSAEEFYRYTYLSIHLTALVVVDVVDDDDDDLHTPAESLFNNIINSFLLDFE